MDPYKVGQKAISVSMRYFESKQYSVEDVSGKPEHRGYDLIIKKGQENLEIEVKGSKNIWRIPDFHVTEFDEEKRLIADFLCVVYLIELEEPKVCMIPRDAILPEYVSPLCGYRISSKFTKESVLRPFLKN